LIDVASDPTQRLFRKCLAEIVLRCPHTDEGCDWQGSYEDYTKHLENCGQAKVECPHEGCRVRPRRSALETHVQSCPWRPVECPHCKETIPYRDLASHEKEVSLRSCELTAIHRRLNELQKTVDTLSERVGTVERGTATEPSINCLQKELELFFSSAPDEHIGFTVEDAKRNARFANVPPEEIDDAISTMLWEGILYTTVDEFHYRATHAPPDGPEPGDPRIVPRTAPRSPLSAFDPLRAQMSPSPSRSPNM
jgi:hypothetical protein